MEINRSTVARRLTAHRYGASTPRIESILSKLDDEEVRDLMYVCQRAAEKLGEDAFSTESVRCEACMDSGYADYAAVPCPACHGRP